MAAERAVRPPVPETLEEALSPAWLTAALSTRYPGLEIREVTPGPVVSRLSTNARFHIDGDGPLPDGLPADLCIKGYFTDHGQRPIAVGVAESTFYRDLAGPTGVRTLRCHYADVHEPTSASVVITDDVVAAGGTFLDPLSTYTVDDAAQSLGELARLHVATWMDPACQAAAWLSPWFGLLGASRGVAEISANFDGPIGAGVPASVRDAQRLYDAFCTVAGDASAAEPWCVVHGDPHAANLFRDAAGRPGLLDWQLVQRGPWPIDVGYHLAAVLPVEDRRRHEHDLVQHYLDHLRAGGVPVPSDDEVERGLCRGMVHGFYLWGITVLVDAPITTALLERLGTAVDDHDALADLVPRSG